jgi:hypothetical protein
MSEKREGRGVASPPPREAKTEDISPSFRGPRSRGTCCVAAAARVRVVRRGRRVEVRGGERRSAESMLAIFCYAVDVRVSIERKSQEYRENRNILREHDVGCSDLYLHLRWRRKKLLRRLMKGKRRGIPILGSVRFQDLAEGKLSELWRRRLRRDINVQSSSVGTEHSLKYIEGLPFEYHCTRVLP